MQQDKALRRTIRATTALSFALALLTTLAVGPVILTTYLINASNANALVSSRAELLVDGLENQVRGLLDPIERQLENAKAHIERNNLDPEDPVVFETYIKGLIDSTPQVAGMGFLRNNGTMRRWEQGVDEAIEESADALPLAPQFLAERFFMQETTWSAPFFSLVLNDTMLNPRIALRRAGKTIGVLTVGVTATRLSQYARRISNDTVTAFILYDRDRLITYPGFEQINKPTENTTLRGIEKSNLAIIRNIWDEQNELTQASRMERTQGHWATIDGTSYAYFYREVEGYAPEPLLIGVAVLSAESVWFRWAAFGSAVLGLGLLGLAIIAAIFTGRRLAAPVEQLNGALEKLENMKFNEVNLPNLEKSTISEWRNSSLKLKQTAAALSSFNQYVPGRLSRRLMRQPKEAALPQERNVTVMFIDMEGFSTYARKHSAEQAAQTLNEVFGLIGPMIEGTGGVIDKYTGDGLMAFWGAPDEQKDHPQLALDTALMIKREVPDLLSSEAPRLRIGLHTGPVIVGNLGFEGRLNYTIIGNTVNTAERVEQSLRGVLPEERIIVGFSSDIAAATATDIEPVTTLTAKDGKTDVRVI